MSRLYDTKSRTVIFDLDGTLFDASHRLHYITPQLPKGTVTVAPEDTMFHGVGTFKPDWDTFFKACKDDRPIWATVDVALALKAAGFKVLVITGRSDEVKYETEVSIHAYLGWLLIEGDYTLRMRRAGDHRPDNIVKEEILNQLFPTAEDKATILGVFEDRPRVVEMYRNNGLTVFQLPFTEWPK